MSSELITTKTENNILFVTINRPEKRNALTINMMSLLAEAIRNSDKNPELRAIIVTGEGPTFSSGIDIMTLALAKGRAGKQNPARWLRRLAGELQQGLNDIEATELPIIGALHGSVLGMGLELALSFDFRVAAESCELRMPEVTFGLVADVGGTTRLSRLVGPSRAKDMLMTARPVFAEEALQWGLVNRVVKDDELLDEAIALADQIAQHAPLAVGLFKRIIDVGDGLDRLTQMELERWAQSQLITAEDTAEAMKAFVQRRKPEFKGK